MASMAEVVFRNIPNFLFIVKSRMKLFTENGPNGPIRKLTDAVF